MRESLVFCVLKSPRSLESVLSQCIKERLIIPDSPGRFLISSLIYVLSRSLLGRITITTSASEAKNEKRSYLRDRIRAGTVWDLKLICSWTNSLISLFFLYKGHSKLVHYHLASKQRGDKGEIKKCSFCSKPGHGANYCPVNPTARIVV